MANSGQMVTAVSTYDMLNFKRLRPSWLQREPPPGLKRELWVYSSRLRRPSSHLSLEQPLLRSRLSRICGARQSYRRHRIRLCRGSISMVHPRAADTSQAIGSFITIFDDYVLYQPSRSSDILRQESELVDRAALNALPVETLQAESLQARFSSRADRIRHFLLVSSRTCWNPNPDAPAPRPGSRLCRQPD